MWGKNHPGLRLEALPGPRGRPAPARRPGANLQRAASRLRPGWSFFTAVFPEA